MFTGSVYKIYNEQNQYLVYIGCTKLSLEKRLRAHVSQHRNNSKLRDECSVSKIINMYGIEGLKIELIKEYEVIDKRHLQVYEALAIARHRRDSSYTVVNIYDGMYIGSVLYNRIVYIKNRDFILQKCKRYYELNRDIITKKYAIYYQKNKEMYKRNAKKYYEKNKEILRQKQKDYYQNVVKPKKKKEKERTLESVELDIERALRWRYSQLP
jgi:hypothetical protein